MFSRYKLHIPQCSQVPGLEVLTGHSSGLLISDRRNRLGDDVIEACECLKAWQRDGFLLSQEVQDIEELLQWLEEQGISNEKAKN